MGTGLTIHVRFARSSNANEAGKAMDNLSCYYVIVK